MIDVTRDDLYDLVEEFSDIPKKDIPMIITQMYNVIDHYNSMERFKLDRKSNKIVMERKSLLKK